MFNNIFSELTYTICSLFSYPPAPAAETRLDGAEQLTSAMGQTPDAVSSSGLSTAEDDSDGAAVRHLLFLHMNAANPCFDAAKTTWGTAGTSSSSIDSEFGSGF